MAPVVKLVNVVLENDDGEEITFDALSEKTTVYALKCLVAEKWPLPPVCQKVLLDDKPATDSQRIFEFVPSSSDLVLGAIEECYDDLSTYLAHDSPALRIMAVKAMSQVAKRDWERAMEALGAALEDPDEDVRRATVDTLCRLARKGEDDVVLLLCTRIADYDAGVRGAAMDGLYQLAGRGNAKVCEAVLDHFENWRSDVRRQAVKALRQVAKAGNDACITALCGSLADPDVEVRHLALEALRDLAPKGNQVACKNLEAYLAHAEPEIRAMAMRALRRVCPEGGSEQLAALLMQQLADPQALVRRTAVDALAAASPRGEPEDAEPALRALLEMIGNPMPPLPEPEAEEEKGSDDEDEPPPPVPEPAKGEGEEDEEDEEESEPPPAPVDEDWRVRRSVVCALAGLARVGDGYVIVALARRMEDEVGEVRKVAVEALLKLSPRLWKEGPSKSIIVTSHQHMVVPFNDGKKWACYDQCFECTRKVEGLAKRWSCQLCHYDLCRGCVDNYRSDRLALGEVLARLDHPSEDVQMAAVRALVGTKDNSLMPPGDIPLLSRLVKFMRRGGLQMRRLALGSLIQLLPTNDPKLAEQAQLAATLLEPWTGVREPPPEEEVRALEKEKEKAEKLAKKAAEREAKGKGTGKGKGPPPSGKKEEEKQAEEEQNDAEEGEEEELEEEPEEDPDEDISTEVLKPLRPAEALEVLSSAVRRFVLGHLEDPLAEDRRFFLALLPYFVPNEDDEDANAALNRLLKDRDPEVKRVVLDLLEKRKSERPLLEHSNYPLGVTLDGAGFVNLFPGSRGGSPRSPSPFGTMSPNVTARTSSARGFTNRSMSPAEN